MKIVIQTIAYFLFLLLISCATKGAPSGGPVDREPPKVVGTFPNADSLQLKTNLQYIEIQFSERMTESSLARSLFISPHLSFEIEWQNAETVRMIINDSLRKDQTYVISVGAEASDARQNKMKDSYQFAFSTGSHIDRGAISGRIFDLEKNETAAAFAYILDDTSRFNPVDKQPFYISQTGERGRFGLNYLKNGQYRIVAVQDLNNNMQLDPAYEKFGLPYRDVFLDSSVQIAKNVDFRLTKIDTTYPEFVSVRPINHKRIQLRFSEPPVLDLESVTIVDSLSGDSLSIHAFAQDKDNKSTFLVFSDIMDSAAYYQVFINNLSDSSGNIKKDANYLSFPASTNDDTTSFRIIEISPQDSALGIRPEQAVAIVFSEPPNLASLVENYTLSGFDGKDVTGQWKRVDALKYMLRPNQLFTTDSTYYFSLFMSEIKNVWGESLADSVHKRIFSVVSEKETGELSGTVIWEDTLQIPIYTHLENLSQNRVVQTKRLDKKRDFFYRYLEPGKYTINGFVDLNKDSTYSHGQIDPFVFAEPFYFAEDTINIRKRWETEGYYLEIPNRMAEK